MSALKAIRLKCMDCVCQQIVEVRECPSNDCPIHPYRMGRNPPEKKRKLSEQTLAAMRERAAARAKANQTA